MGKSKETKIALTDDQKSELIRLWEGEECLYNVNSVDYHENGKRLNALKNIAKMMSKSIEIDHEQVKSVCKNLRTTFLRKT